MMMRPRIARPPALISATVLCIACGMSGDRFMVQLNASDRLVCFTEVFPYDQPGGEIRQRERRGTSRSACPAN